jgi:excisionase family DNA binding protein
MVSRMIESLIGIEDVSASLGVKKSTVYAWVHAREIPHYKIGRLVKFKKRDVENWVEGRRVRVIS